MAVTGRVIVLFLAVMLALSVSLPIMAAPAAAAAVLPLPKLLAFYSLDGNTNDYSGSGNHATAVGATPGWEGIEGTSYHFNKSTYYIDTPVNINPDKYPQLTMGAWVQAHDPYPIQQVLSHDDGNFDRSLCMDYRGGGSGWSAFDGSGVLGYQPVTVAQWTFLAVVYDQTAKTVTLYIDDQVPIVGTGELGSSANLLNIGRNPSGFEYFNGFIDNVFVFAGALAAEQIAYLRTGKSAAILSAAAGRNAPPVNSLLLD